MRLIDADELRNYKTPIQTTYDGGYIEVVGWNRIENAPTIEPKKGKWIWVQPNASALICSNCLKECRSDYEEDISYYDKTNFCPQCGADMREE